MRKYRLIHFAAFKTGNNRRKLSTSSSKVIEVKKSKRGFERKLYESVADFYGRDDSSTALPGKSDAESIKRNMPKLRKIVLNNYLSSLYSKYVAENPNHNLSFSTLARMRLSYYVLANFVNRRLCLCTQHLNMSLKLKTVKKDNKDISVHPNIFIKYQSEGNNDASLQLIDLDRCEYETWKKVPRSIKSKSGEEKVVHKMKIVKEVAELTVFKQLFKSEIKRFRDYAKRIQNQFVVQKYLKDNLRPNHVYIHMGFAEDYRCTKE